MNFSKWIRTALALTLVFSMLAPAFSDLPFDLPSLGVLDVHAEESTDQTIKTNVSWSTDCVLSTNYTGTGGKQQYYLVLENENTAAKEGLFSDVFDYEIVARQPATADGYGTTNTVIYSVDNGTETFEFKNIKTAGNSNPSGIYLRLTPKKNATINLSFSCEAAKEVYCYYYWTDPSTSTTHYYDFISQTELTTAKSYNTSEKSVSNVSHEVYAATEKPGYIEISLENSSAKAVKSMTLTINSVVEKADSVMVNAVPEDANTGSVTLRDYEKWGDLNSQIYTEIDSGTKVKIGHKVMVYANCAKGYEFEGFYDKESGDLITTEDYYGKEIKTADDKIDLVARFYKAASVYFEHVPTINVDVDGTYSVHSEKEGTQLGEVTGTSRLLEHTGRTTDTVWLRAWPNSDRNAVFAGWYVGEAYNQNGGSASVASGLEWLNNAELISMERVISVNLGQYEGKTISPIYIRSAGGTSATFVKPTDGGSFYYDNSNNSTDDRTQVTGNVTLAIPIVNSNAWGQSAQDVLIYAVPNTDYEFVGWKDLTTGEMLPGGESCMITLGAINGHQFTAIFEKIGDVYKDFEYVEHGSYTVNGTTVPSTGLHSGTGPSGSFTLQATPDSLYKFVKWVNADGLEVSRANPYVLPVGDAAVKPVFEYNGSEITLNAPVRGSYTVTVDETTYTMQPGSAAQKLTLDKDTQFTLNATVPTGYVFYYWANGSSRISSSASYTGTLPANAQLNAVFVQSGAARYNVGDGISYAYLDEAITAAGSSGTITVINGGNVYGSDGRTTFTIPAGVTLLVPHANGMIADSSNFAYACVTHTTSTSVSNPAAPGDSNTFLKLTVPSGTTINVNGLMAVGGTVSGTGMITGAHSDVYLANGATINVGDGAAYNSGKLSSCGFIYGDGTVNVKKGGRMYVPFTINDFKGGGYTVGVTSQVADKNTITVSPEITHPSGEAVLMPFIRYSVMAVQCKQVVNYGGYVDAYVDLYAGGDHNYSRITLIGEYDTSYMQCLIRLHEGATATIEYSKTNVIENVGRTKITLDGNTEFGYFSIYLNAQGVVKATINTSSLTFPVPYNYDVVVNSGTFTITNSMMLLPGATLTVNEGATMNVNAKVTVFDGLQDYTAVRNMGSTETGGGNTGNKFIFHSAFANDSRIDSATTAFMAAGSVGSQSPYPTTQQLQNAGLSGSAQLIVNGTLNLNSGAFGGLIQSTSNTGKIVVASGFTTQTTTQIGGVGYWYTNITGDYEFSYELVGATVRTLKAQVFAADGSRIDLVAGKSYLSATGDHTVKSYTYDVYYADKYNTKYKLTDSQNVSIAHSGSWRIDCEGNHTYTNSCDTVCNVCGETRTITHTYNDGVVTTQPTCTTPGVKTYTCTVCGDTYTEAISQLGHKWTDATCTAPKTCSVCGATEGDALGHKYESIVTNPTCTEKGYTTHTCSVCSDSYKDSETAATGHTPAAAVKENEKASTCTVAGSYDEVVYCSVCNTELSRETKALELAAHTEGAVVVENEVAATCTAEGSYDNVVYCSVCNAELSRNTVTVEKIAHTPAAAVVENRVESTCTVAGSYDQVVYCSACNTELSRETKALELAAHTEGAVVVENEKAATCTAQGSYDNVVYCTVCNAELSRDTITVNVTDHTYVDGVCTGCGEKEPLVPTIGNGTTVGTVDENGSVTVTYGATEITVAAPASGWIVGENTFNVESTNDIACVVLVKKADGGYDKIPASMVDGKHSFTATLAVGDQIILAVFGDLNGDGIVDTIDAGQMQRIAVKSRTCTELNVLTCDINGDGVVDTIDAGQAQRVAVKSRTLQW